MKTTFSLGLALLLVLSEAQAQQPPSATQTPATQTPAAAADAAALARSARASTLIGSKVYKGDTAVGQIEDVMVDLDQARVSAVILSVGGFLGMGDKLVAVAVDQIRVGPEARFTTDVTREQLTSAPAFDFSKLK